MKVVAIVEIYDWIYQSNSPLSLKAEHVKIKLNHKSQMLEIKANFRNKYKEFKCDACKEKRLMKKETQRHIYKCMQLSENKLHKIKPKFRKIYEKSEHNERNSSNLKRKYE